MKKIYVIIFIHFFLLQITHAQQVINYNKLNVPSVDAAGKIADAKGNHLGNIAENGIITNTAGEKVATIDAFNNTIDEKTGERTGKTDNDGNFGITVNKRFISWKTSAPETGVQVCLVKDLKGNIVAVVHKKFKQYGSSAVYFLLSKLTPPIEEAKKTVEKTELDATNTKPLPANTKLTQKSSKKAPTKKKTTTITKTKSTTTKKKK